jgi:hypothetical protein
VCCSRALHLCTAQGLHSMPATWQNVSHGRSVLMRMCASAQVLTNAGQANAATGDQGYADAVECAKAMAAALGVTPDDVLLQSTGAPAAAATDHPHAASTSALPQIEEPECLPLPVQPRSIIRSPTSTRLLRQAVTRCPHVYMVVPFCVHMVVHSVHSKASLSCLTVPVLRARRCDWSPHEDGGLPASHP